MRKHLLLTMVCLLTAVASWAQAFNIGGHRAVLDSLNNILDTNQHIINRIEQISN